MAVAFLALLAALSGTAVALPGKNRVDSGDIKRNVIRSSDVRNNALRGVDVRNNAITGRDVNESRLGEVPSATNADNATNATNAVNAQNANEAASHGGLRRLEVDQFTLANGSTREVLRHGPFVLTARCRLDFDPDGGGAQPPQDDAALLIDTNADNAAVNGDDVDADFDAAEAPISLFDVVVSPVNTIGFDHPDDALAVAADGSQVLATEMWAAVNAFGVLDECRFGGFLATG